MQDVEEQRFQQFRRVTPSAEVEGLEILERKSVVRIVEEESILPCAGPAVEPVFQFADNAGEIGKGPLTRLQHVDSLNGIPELDLFLEVQFVSLVIAFDEHAQQAEKKLLILSGGGQREWIDREVALLAADVQIAAAEDVRQRLEASTNVEDEGQRAVLLCVL